MNRMSAKKLEVIKEEILRQRPDLNTQKIDSIISDIRDHDEFTESQGNEHAYQYAIADKFDSIKKVLLSEFEETDPVMKNMEKIRKTVLNSPAVNEHRANTYRRNTRKSNMANSNSNANSVWNAYSSHWEQKYANARAQKGGKGKRKTRKSRNKR
jgi:hypothetical protein